MTAPPQHAKLVLRAGVAEILINGTEFAKSITGLTLKAGVGLVPQLDLSLLLYEIEVDGDVRITVPSDSRDKLLALGWTPPPEVQLPPQPPAELPHDYLLCRMVRPEGGICVLRRGHAFEHETLDGAIWSRRIADGE